MSLPHQDWEPVIIRKPQRRNKKVTDAERLNGVGVTVAKSGGGKNNQSFKGSSLSKLQRSAMENDGQPGKIVKIDKSISQNIQNARAAQNLTRKELAQKMNQPVSVIAEYENGKAIPNANLINKLEKVLKTKLR